MPGNAPAELILIGGDSRLGIPVCHYHRGAAEIRVSLAKVESLLTSGQITEGQRLAREFKAREISSQPAATNQVSLSGTNVVQNSSPSSDSNLFGSVSVAADDPKAEVMVDGNFVGNAPARVKLAPGSHVIEVKSPGKKSFRRELMVSAGADLTLRAQLQAE